MSLFNNIFANLYKYMYINLMQNIFSIYKLYNIAFNLRKYMNFIKIT